MRGRHPKDPKIRQRRNKPPTSSAELSDATVVRDVPKLPPLGPGEDGKRRQWHPRTVAWWKDVWTSPMAERYLTADVHQLFIAAALVDEFWRSPSTTLAAEVRRQLEQFGLTSMARKRLDWRIREAPAEVPVESQAPAKAAAGSGARRQREPGDPRDAFRVVDGGKS